jgi:hypothetical protein
MAKSKGTTAGVSATSSTAVTGADLDAARTLALQSMQKATEPTFLNAMRKIGTKRALYRAGIEHATRVIAERDEALAEGGDIDTIELEVVAAYQQGDERSINKAIAKLDKVKVVGTELPNSINPLKN